LSAAGATGATAAKRLMVSVQVVWLAGRGGQAALDATMAWQEPADVILRVQEPGPAVPRGAVLLSDVLIGNGGVGPSGTAIDVILGNVHLPFSTSQWVGCEGAAAWGSYALDSRRRLTALLGLRDFTPLELVVGVRVLVDGVLVAEFTVDGPATPSTCTSPRAESCNWRASGSPGLARARQRATACGATRRSPDQRPARRYDGCRVDDGATEHSACGHASARASAEACRADRGWWGCRSQILIAATSMVPW
jgi:hypothetical protein